MKTVFILLLFFLGVGIFARSFNRRTSIVLAAGIAAVVLYLTIS